MKTILIAISFNVWIDECEAIKKINTWSPRWRWEYVWENYGGIKFLHRAEIVFVSDRTT